MGAGGSEARVMRAIEAFQDEYDCTLISTAVPDIERLNKTYGTQVDAAKLCVLAPRPPLPLRPMMRFDAARGSWHARICRGAARDYDVALGMYNPVDFGVPAIQCIADFCFDEGFRRQYLSYPSGWRRFLYQDNQARRAYKWLCRRICGKPSGLDKAQSVYIATSSWAAHEYAQRNGVPVSVIYPPVVGGFPDIPWESRENGFVCIGRVSVEKRVELAIEVVRRVRALGHDVHLHIVGPTHDSPYGRRIRDISRPHESWVRLEGGVYGEAKKKILAQHRYGIHACRGEAFGAAVAEMVKAGCIAFVPGEGGQAEVVNHAALTYSSPDEAVAKIVAVLRDEAAQAALREKLAKQATLFGVEQFKAGIRAAVARFLAQKAGK